jgi:serine/threonine protein phosphatase 1
MIEFAPAPATLSPDMRVYAVGDVHGSLDQLTALHADIAKDLARRPVAESLLIHLGDYVDRGPNSAGVVDLLSANGELCGMPVLNLMGNHEDLMLSAIDTASAEAVRLWLMNGGAHSLHSWGVGPLSEPRGWAAQLPARHLAFLRGLKLSHSLGGYLFVHAGLRPGAPPQHQSRHDLLWIREPFLSSAADFGIVVVHGHTPRPRPEVRRNRIGIDTGAVMGGQLTCAVLEGNRVGFISR